MSATQDSQRWTVLFSGTVQGVGFRYTVRQVAGGFAVTGDVRNLPDGRVELRAEGEPAELRRFVAAIEETMGRYIRGRETRESPATAEFSGFSITF